MSEFEEWPWIVAKGFNVEEIFGTCQTEFLLFFVDAYIHEIMISVGTHLNR